MGHSTHFLERLNRVNPWHTEAALALYRDPALVREVLRRTRVPEGAPRVALALEDTGRGPHIIVSREGGFITCLGEGMEPYDVFRVSRAELDSIRELRDMISLSLKALQDGTDEILSMGGGEYFMRRLLRGAHNVNKADIRIIRKLSPVIAKDIILNYSGRHIKLSNMRKNLISFLNQKRGEQILIKSFQNELRNYWCEIWAHNHITTLFGIWQKHLEWDTLITSDTEIDESIQEDVARYGQRALQQVMLALAPWTASRAGSWLHMIRATWGVARCFPLTEDRTLLAIANNIHKDIGITYRNAISLWGRLIIIDDDAANHLFDRMADSFGVKRTTLAAEGYPLRPALEPLDDNPYLAYNLSLINYADALRRSDPSAIDELFKECRQDLINAISARKSSQKQHHTTLIKQLNDDDFFLHWLTACPPFKGDSKIMQMLVLAIAKSMRYKQPEDLYMEDTTNPLLWPKYEPEMSINYLKNDLLADTQHPTKHHAPRPGRNEPCPCGSGQKYKRCCALKDEAAAGDEA